jgi:hypothetical protein
MMHYLRCTGLLTSCERIWTRQFPAARFRTPTDPLCEKSHYDDLYPGQVLPLLLHWDQNGLC